MSLVWHFHGLLWSQYVFRWSPPIWWSTPRYSTPTARWWRFNMKSSSPSPTGWPFSTTRPDVQPPATSEWAWTAMWPVTLTSMMQTASCKAPQSTSGLSGVIVTTSMGTLIYLATEPVQGMLAHKPIYCTESIEYKRNCLFVINKLIIQISSEIFIIHCKAVDKYLKHGSQRKPIK